MENNKLLSAQDRVLGRLGDAELHDALGRNLNLLASGRITAETGLAIDQHELTNAREGESVFGILVSEHGNVLQNFLCLLLLDASLFSDLGGDLRLG